MSHRSFLRFTLLVAVALAAFCASSPSAKADAAGRSRGVVSDLDIDNEEGLENSHRDSASAGKRSGGGSRLYAEKKKATKNKKLSIGVDVDEEMDLDAEFDSGVDAVLGKKDDDGDYGNVLSGRNTGHDDNDEEQPDELDYTDKDDEDEDEEAEVSTTDQKGKMNENKKKNAHPKKKSRGTGVLPQLADQAEKLLSQANELSENAEVFKREVAELRGLPKRLENISEKMKKLAKDPSYATNALMYTTQAKKVKEQGRRIEDIISQLLRSIPDYEREAEKLTLQSEKIRDIADQHILQGLSSEDESIVELRKEVRGLEKDYAKNLKKSNQLRKSLQQLKEQGDSVDQLVKALPYHEDDDKNKEEEDNDKAAQAEKAGANGGDTNKKGKTSKKDNKKDHSRHDEKKSKKNLASSVKKPKTSQK